MLKFLLAALFLALAAPAFADPTPIIVDSKKAPLPPPAPKPPQ